MADHVVIKIKGDDSHYKAKLSGLKSATLTAVKGITAVTGALATAWNAAGLAMVSYNGNLEQLRTSFEVMTGSAAKGAEVLERIRALGASTPFEMQGLAETTQLLMNYNLTADDALAKMTMLGDISQGDQDKLTRIATAYGQMSSAGKVALEDVKQMIEAGFNPLVEISESTGESMASLYTRISKGKLAVDEITASMERSTSVGGKYFQSMEKQSQTLNGRISTLKDNVQQLGGNVFQSYTDGLRDSAVPAANEIVEELNAAFMARGMDGLTDALITQIPRVSTAVGDAFKNGIASAGKQAPKLIKGLISSLPSVLSGGGDIANALTEVFFDAASAGLEGLLANSPELIAGAVDFGLELGGNIVEGVIQAAAGMGRGILSALKKVGAVSKNEQDLLQELLAGYDPEKVRELKAQVKITPEMTVDESKVKLTNIYDVIAKQLTDGKADSPEEMAELKNQVVAYYDAEIEKVNQWKQEALAGLDTTLPQDEYAAAAAAIESDATTMITALQGASDQTVKFISTNAGKSTDAVNKNLQDLESIYQATVGYRDKVAALTGEAGSMAEKQRQVVAAGQSRDAGTQLGALAYTAMEYQTALTAAEEKKAAALQEALGSFEQGSTEYSAREAEILAEFEVENKAAAEKYAANMNATWAGIGKAMMPEQQALLQDALKQSELVGQARGLLQQAFEGEQLRPEDISEDMAALLNLQGIDMDELIAGSMGDENALSEALKGALTAVVKNGEEMDLSSVLASLMEGMPEDVKNVYQTAIEQGYMQAVEGMDFSDDNTLLTLLAGAMPSKEEATTIGKPAGEAAILGMEQGLKNKENQLVSTAGRIAGRVASIIRDTLQIRSPSRVTMRLGEYTGEGFDIGLSNSLNRAVRHAGQIAGALNLSPKLTAPDLTGAFGTAVGSLADGMAQPVYLQVDGRTLAQVTVGNNARAANQFNRNIALGVGK